MPCCRTTTKTLLLVLATTASITNAQSQRGMPLGHPFQGSQPKHLEEEEPKFKLPSSSVLARKSNEMHNYDTKKMMRYDDFSNEDVGNIIMDEEAGSAHQRRRSLKETLQEANTYPGISEFDEASNLNTAANRPLYLRRHPRPHSSGRIRTMPRLSNLAGRHFTTRGRLHQPQFRRFPGGQQHRFQRPQGQFQPPKRNANKPQLTLRDTFIQNNAEAYDNYENPEALADVEIDYYDEEITYPELEQESELLPLLNEDQLQMDALYKLYAKIRHEQLNANNATALSRRILDASSAVGLFGFLLSQLDVLTALSVVSNLEARAQYDPQFRTSFPDFLRRNSWFLPPKKYKIVPHSRPLGHVVPGGQYGGQRGRNPGLLHNGPIYKDGEIISTYDQPLQIDDYNNGSDFPELQPLQIDDASFYSSSGHSNSHGNSGFFSGKPQNFPSLQELAGRGFDLPASTQNLRRRSYENDNRRTFGGSRRKNRRLLIALDKDYLSSQRLLSEKL